MKLTVFSPDGTTSREQDFAGLPTFANPRNAAAGTGRGNVSVPPAGTFAGNSPGNS